MITSKQNDTFKLCQKLKLKKYRDIYELYLVYGKHLVDLAIKNNLVKEVLTTNIDVKGTLISNELMDLLSQTETTYDIMAICYKRLKVQKSLRILVLDDIQDPDNLGALFRSALAFGFKHIIISLKSADQYNEKAIRASKGAIFNLFIERKPLKEAINELKENGFNIIAAALNGENNIKKEHKKIALILGNEGKGIKEEYIEMADNVVTIKTQDVESLNVSVAGAILMYEWSK